MKKFILLAAFAFAAFAAQAQTSVKLPLALGDTIVNAGTVSKYVSVTGGYNGAIVQVVLTKISGTGVGTVQLSQTLDGVNYVNVGSAFTITDVATQSQVFALTSPTGSKIKVLCTGSGTEAVKVAVWYRLPLFQHP